MDSKPRTHPPIRVVSFSKIFNTTTLQSSEIEKKEEKTSETNKPNTLTDNHDITKLCYKCKQIKPYTNYYTDISRPDSLSAACIACKKVAKKEASLAKKHNEARKFWQFYDKHPLLSVLSSKYFPGLACFSNTKPSALTYLYLYQIDRRSISTYIDVYNELFVQSKSKERNLNSDDFFSTEQLISSSSLYDKSTSKFFNFQIPTNILKNKRYFLIFQQCCKCKQFKQTYSAYSVLTTRYRKAFDPVSVKYNSETDDDYDLDQLATNLFSLFNYRNHHKRIKLYEDEFELANWDNALGWKRQCKICSGKAHEIITKHTLTKKEKEKWKEQENELIPDEDEDEDDLTFKWLSPKTPKS